MSGRFVAVSLIVLVGFGLIYGRLRNFMIGEVTPTDHPILRALDAPGEISSTDAAFRDVDEVCIVNETDISKPGSRNCKTSGEVLALIRGGSCDIIPLERLRVRVLLSENTSECRKTASGFRIVIHRRNDSEFLDFD